MMNTMMRYISAMASLLLLAGCVTTQHPPLELTFLPQKGDFIGPDGSELTFHKALKLAAGADYIVLGEGHKNQCDHDLQQRIVRGLVEIGHAPAIGLEMVPVSLQATLDRFNAGEISSKDLGRELDWKSTWGYPYKLFSPLFEIAEQRGLPVAGLNAPKAVSQKASREGVEALTDEDLQYYPSRVIPHLPEQEKELAFIFEMHGDKIGADARLKRFLLVQSIWDSMMAEQAVALRGRTKRPVVVIAGAGHVDSGYGIPRRIRMFDPSAKVVTLVPLRDLRWYEKDMGSAAFYCPEAYESRMKMTLEVVRGRVVVTEVQPDGRAATAGVRPGDELVTAQGRTVRGLMDLHKAGAIAHDTNKPLVLGFDRFGDRVRINLGRLGKPKGADSRDMPSQDGDSEKKAEEMKTMQEESESE